MVVSHSRKLAEGVVELAGQMAPEVRLVAVGGDGGGGLGTDYAAVVEGLADADGGGGVVVLFDLGSARMVADLAVEEFGGAAAVVDAPLVTGAVAAAVAAQGGAALEAVVAAALWAWGSGERAGGGAAGDGADGGADGGAGAGAGAGAGPGGAGGAAGDGVVRAVVPLVNDVGLHARPAGLVARALAGVDARVVVRHGGREVDARSVLELMGLGATGGDSVEVVAVGVDAEEAVRRVTELAARGFDG
ncbi:dihydroxyacetone kinase, phosphotransfer subunit [Actinosynnema mirum DSM 43827]|uniref:Dihydroxyacetone kinase, phosphotransfer subunit n=1 Tax=Actinosynnema mirum (strain ATCC 29888 / DSM 43827 / JCM 3225 / NBRC 14064 / NCIMB 13271 / NRRL B-12336 / IMRU 3971 / 101) TaxID=446462 RepID=C6WHH0_ACTMD|nr:dihydroxyacetone kinase, phosphotransfer subunit [Actinosynnema mirum DSM 43827]